MSIRIGDSIFVRGGQPATVKDRDSVTGKLSLELDPEKVRTEARHGYLNGMAMETRQAFYEILDQVKGESEDPGDRVEKLRLKIDELEQDPRNLHLSRYLKAEMTHIMNTYNIRPKEYTVYEGRIK